MFETSYTLNMGIGGSYVKGINAKNYDKLKRELEKETPLHVVLADTTAISSTDYLLEHITNLIRDSAGCIFDVTGGNPNVSLEVGVAHALPADFLLALYTRKPRVTQSTAQRALEHEGETKPIISDLQGRNRVEYKTYRASGLCSSCGMVSSLFRKSAGSALPRV